MFANGYANQAKCASHFAPFCNRVSATLRNTHTARLVEHMLCMQRINPHIANERVSSDQVSEKILAQTPSELLLDGSGSHRPRWTTQPDSVRGCLSHPDVYIQLNAWEDLAPLSRPNIHHSCTYYYSSAQRPRPTGESHDGES